MDGLARLEIIVERHFPLFGEVDELIEDDEIAAPDTFTGTVWGEPSSPLREGEIAGIPVAVLARHGRSHTIAPSSVNYRANIQALKDAGCTHILATTATGSLRKEIRRGDLVILDQFIDFTKQRKE